MAVLQMQRISICALKHEPESDFGRTAVHGQYWRSCAGRMDPELKTMDTQSAKSSFEKRVRSRKTHWMY